MLNDFHVDAWGLPTLGTLLNFVTRVTKLDPSKVWQIAAL